MKKLSVIGAGSAGLLSAVQSYYSFVNTPDWEVELIHDPNIPPEKVGQGTVPGIMNLLSIVFDIDWVDNPIEATQKHGIMYKNWGKKKDKFFHPFGMGYSAAHYDVNKLREFILSSKKFNVLEKNINTDVYTSMSAEWTITPSGSEFPSGALYRFEPALFGDENIAGGNATGSFYHKNEVGGGVNFSSQSVFDTDPTASAFSNNVVVSSVIQIDSLPTSSDFGTVAWVWRYRPTGSQHEPLRYDFLFDMRDGGSGQSDKGIANAFIQLGSGTNVGSVYQSSSMYNAFGNEDLQEYEINKDNVITQTTDLSFSTGSQSFPGYFNNTITGSAGDIFQDTGSNAYRFTAFSPNSAQTPIGTTSEYTIIIGGSDNTQEDGIPANEFNYSSLNQTNNVFNIAAVAVFNRVLSDSEVRDVFNYYTGSLGIEIGL